MMCMSSLRCVERGDPVRRIVVRWCELSTCRSFGGTHAAPIEKARHAVALALVELLRRCRVIGKFVLHGVELPIERLGGFTDIRAVRRRIALVESASLGRKERLRRAHRSNGLLVALGDGAFRDAALLEGARRRRHNVRGAYDLLCGSLILALIGVIFFVAGRDLASASRKYFRAAV